MSWFIHRFKPFIDHNFRTLPDRAHTFIGGSSMGGLMSLYALLQYNDTFSRAAALSPSIWVAPESSPALWAAQSWSPARCSTWTTAPRRWATTRECAETLPRCAASHDPGHPPDQPHGARRHPQRSQLGKTAAFVFHTLMYEVDALATPRRRVNTGEGTKGGNTMEMQYFKDYSPALGREMECKVYGHAGRPMLYIPCQDGRFFDFENFHMADTLAPWIESGKIMVLSIDTMDQGNLVRHQRQPLLAHPPL